MKEDNFLIKLHKNSLELLIYYMRGGTSTGVIIFDEFLPKDHKLKEEIIKNIMGVPLKGEVKNNYQITGLGRGYPTSNKVFILEQFNGRKTEIKSTLAQLAATKSKIDWSVNCGNMSSAIPMAALDYGLIECSTGINEIDIFNTNTQQEMKAYINIQDNEITPNINIPGVMGQYPKVKLKLIDPSGSKTGKLFPTGNLIDIIEGIKVSCIDVAVPMIILRANDVKRTGKESVEKLNIDQKLKKKLKKIWVKAGLKMKLKNKSGTIMSEEELANSETIPKVCLVSEPDGDGHLTARYFTPQKPHKSLAVSGGSCLASACLIEGTIASDLLENKKKTNIAENKYKILIENPAGILEAEIEKEAHQIKNVSYIRNSQILMKGHTKLYNCSSELKVFYRNRLS